MHQTALKGFAYTWDNNQPNSNFFSSRLYRYFANTGQKNLFPSFNNTHLMRYKSDHTPILLDFSSNNVCMPQRKNKDTVYQKRSGCKMKKA